MQKSISQKGFLKFIEIYVRKNFLLYALIRPLVSYFNVFEEDFKILKILYKEELLNILDIGASDGISAKYFIKNLNVKKIFCYEPNKFFFKKLDNLKRKKKNIFLRKYGISNINRSVVIYYPIINFFSYKIPIFTYAFYNLKELQQQLKLDTKNHDKLSLVKSKIFLKKYKIIKEKINLIKIDVNGHELSIIRSLMKQIIKDKPMIVIEKNQDLNKIYFLLKKYGYRKFYNKEMVLKNHTNEEVLNVFFINKNEY